MANTVLTVSVSTARTSKFSHLLRLADNFWWWVTIRVKQSYTGAGKCICDHVFVFSSAPHSTSSLVLFQATAVQPSYWEKHRRSVKIPRWRCSTELLEGAVVKTLWIHICIGYMSQKRAMLGQFMCNWPYLEEFLCCNDVLQHLFIILACLSKQTWSNLAIFNWDCVCAELRPYLDLWSLSQSRGRHLTRMQTK